MTKLKLEKGTDRIENLKIFLIQATTIEFQRSKQGKTASLGLESKHFSFYGEMEFSDALLLSKEPGFSIQNIPYLFDNQ